MNDEKAVRIRELMSLLAMHEGQQVTLKEVDGGDIEIIVDGKICGKYNTEKDMIKGIDESLLPYQKEVNFEMNVVLADKNLLDINSSYKGAALTLPATDSEIEDAFQRARIQDQVPFILYADFEEFKFDYNGYFCQNSTLNELNYFAWLLQKEPNSLQSIDKIKGFIINTGEEKIDAKDLINAIYNLDKYEFIQNVENTRELGRKAYENELIRELIGVSENAIRFVDFSIVGEEFEKKTDGFYMPGGYFYKINDDFEIVYTGTDFPDELEHDHDIFKAQISTTDIYHEDKPATYLLGFPIASKRLSDLPRLLGKDSLEDCVLLTAQSILPDMQYCLHNLSEINALNEMAWKIKKLSSTGQQSKIKAIFQATECKSIEKANECLKHIDDYVLYEKMVSNVDYAKHFLSESQEFNIPQYAEKYFNFQDFADELIKREYVVVTEYGVLKRKEQLGKQQEGSTV